MNAFCLKLRWSFGVGICNFNFAISFHCKEKVEAFVAEVDDWIIIFAKNSEVWFFYEKIDYIIDYKDP